jgi:hypothetical protein
MPKSATGFYSARKTMREKMKMRGRRCDNDDDRPLSPTCRGHTTRGKFSRRFAHISFVRSPRARSGRPEIAWARRMDEGPNSDENEEPGRDWAVFRHPDEKKRMPGPRRARGWRCS